MTTVTSPCVRNCCLDDRDICIGCGRTVDEIIRWGDADGADRLLILKNAKKRLEQREKEKNS